MNRIEENRKAVAAFLSASLGIGALFGWNPAWATPETIGAAAAIVGAITGAVWKVDNRVSGRNVMDVARSVARGGPAGRRD